MAFLVLCVGARSEEYEMVVNSVCGLAPLVARMM